MRRTLAAVIAAYRRRADEIESWVEWIYPNRGLRFTREGLFFLAVTMSIGFAALNTGHNLFYLIFAMLVSLVVVSGLLSERSVRPLRVRRILPGEIFAREPTVVELEIKNVSRKRAAYGVEVREATERRNRRAVGFVSKLEPGAARRFHTLWTFPERGVTRFRTVHLVTRFPFGLFEKTRLVPVRDEFVVFPAVTLESRREGAADTAPSPVRRDRMGDELMNLRPFLSSDDWRLIHWRVSARAGVLTVREQGRALDRPVAIFFDHRGPAGPAFERAIERATGFLWEASREGRRASFYTFETILTSLRGDALRHAYRLLATIEPAPAPATSEGFSRWKAAVEHGAGGVLVSAGDALLEDGASVRKVA